MRRLRELLRNGVPANAIQYYMVLNKGGGKGGTTTVTQPVVNPTPPVEDASVELEEDDNIKKKTGKSSLKIPLSTSATTALNTSSTSTGLKV